MNKVCMLLIVSMVFMSESSQAQLSLMSYNIKYATEKDGENSWSKRKDHLTTQIQFYEPDILGLQEALIGQVEHLKSSLGAYEYVGVGRDDGKDEGEFTAVLYDTRKFEVLESETFWLSKTPDEPSMGWDADYPRICTYVLFRNRETKDEFWVFNTHFDHKGQKAMEESALLVLSKIREINKDDLPVVLMGDLNSEPDSKPVEHLKKDLTDSKEIAEKVVFGPEGTFNAFEFCEPVDRRIDYIFTSPGNIEILKYAVLSDSRDMRYPSDHLPVYVLLKF